MIPTSGRLILEVCVSHRFNIDSSCLRLKIMTPGGEDQTNEYFIYEIEKGIIKITPQ